MSDEKKTENKKERGAVLSKIIIPLLTFILGFLTNFFTNYEKIELLVNNYFRTPNLRYETGEGKECILNSFALKGGSITIYPQLWIMDGDRNIRRIGLAGLYEVRENIAYDKDQMGFVFEAGDWDRAGILAGEICTALEADMGEEETREIRSVKVLLVQMKYSNKESRKNHEKYYAVKIGDGIISELSEKELQPLRNLFEIDFNEGEEYTRRVAIAVQDCEKALGD